MSLSATSDVPTTLVPIENNEESKFNDDQKQSNNVQVEESPQENNLETNSEIKKSNSFKFDQDTVVWAVSMIFLAAVLGAMWIWGSSADWGAQSGYGYNGTGRFDTEPYGCNDTSEPGRSGLPDCTASWYFWKLPTEQITHLSRATMWVMYSLHQISIWVIIYKAQQENTQEYRQKYGIKGSKYGNKLKWYNWASLVINAIFHILHLIQSHWTYDGISQDVSLSSSQSSVVLMISLIMLIEYRDRGIMFMWPNARSTDRFAKKLRLNQKPINYIRKYHGYYFSWAIVYTFWYHPMENTWAHTTGFLHTGMLLIQGSMMYTNLHLNKYWKLINESWVMTHGAIVAVQTANPATPNQLWPMFFFGFGFLLCFTQIYSLPFWKTISQWWRAIPPVTFYLIAFLVFGLYLPSGLRNLWQTINIPSIQYINMLLAWLVLYIYIAIENCVTCKWSYGEPTPGQNVLYLSTILVIYALLMVESVFFNYAEINFLVLMEINVLIYLFAIMITIMFHKRIFGPHRRNPVVGISRSQR